MSQLAKESWFAKQKAGLYFKVIKRARQSLFSKCQVQRRPRYRQSAAQDIRRIQSQIGEECQASQDKGLRLPFQDAVFNMFKVWIHALLFGNDLETIIQ